MDRRVDLPQPNGHIQATGRDARGRKQYRYHPHWREVRDETKFGRMIAFGAGAADDPRRGVERDLALPGLPREKVLATVVRLLESTLIRVGNDEYAKTNSSFGLTTLRDRHVEISRLDAPLRVPRQERQDRTRSTSTTGASRASSSAARTCPGEELFQYLDDDGRAADDRLRRRQRVHPGDHRRRTSPPRTSAPGPAPLLAIEALTKIGPFSTQRNAKSNVLKAIDQVAEQLNNTRSVCRKYYVHPAVLESYMDGKLLEHLGNGSKQGAKHDLAADEAAVVRLLQRPGANGRAT